MKFVQPTYKVIETAIKVFLHLRKIPKYSQMFANDKTGWERYFGGEQVSDSAASGMRED